MIKNTKNACSYAALLLSLSIIPGCGILPKSGPTASNLIKSINGNNGLSYKIVDVDGVIASDLSSDPIVLDKLLLPSKNYDERLDVIHPGDVLQITIHEVGISLFSGGGGSALGRDMGEYSAHSERFNGVSVNQDGQISLPYLGQIMVSGLSVISAQREIERALAGKSQLPQVTVNISDSPYNSVYLSGQIRKPGRIMLNPVGDMLLDMIAAGGGSISQPYDTVIHFTRGTQILESRLNAIDPRDSLNIKLVPGDRIELLQRPLTFTIMGAANRVAQIAFEAEHISLAEALAKASGLNDNQADPKAVFLFRLPKSIDAGDEIKIYRLNMMNASAYFMAQNIKLHDKDVIYVANAEGGIPLKLVSVINQLTSPLVTYRALSQ